MDIMEVWKDYFGNIIELGDEVLFCGPKDDSDGGSGGGLIKGKVVARAENDCTPLIERLWQQKHNGEVREWMEQYRPDLGHVIVLKYITVEREDVTG